MGIRKRQCPVCQTEIIVKFGYNASTDELRWYMSSHCRHCNEYAEEADGTGQLPTILRETELIQTGTWNLKLISLGEQESKGLKAIKETLGLTNQALSKIKQSLPIIIASGTKFEMEFYQSKLTRSYDKITTQVESMS